MTLVGLEIKETLFLNLVDFQSLIQIQVPLSRTGSKVNCSSNGSCQNRNSSESNLFLKGLFCPIYNLGQLG
jgi:hypothetical protein